MYFIVGIGTGVGKTIVSAALCKILQYNYWKPIQSGAVDGCDDEIVAKLSGVKILPSAYSLQDPSSPNIAAEKEKITIDIKSIKTPQQQNLIIEGAGGILVPLNSKETFLDFMILLNMPVILVVGDYLGAINHTLLTIKTLNSAGIKIKGLIFNGDNRHETKKTIEEHGKINFIATMPQLNPINFDNQKFLTFQDEVLSFFIQIH